MPAQALPSNFRLHLGLLYVNSQIFACFWHQQPEETKPDGDNVGVHVEYISFALNVWLNHPVTPA